MLVATIGGPMPILFGLFFGLGCGAAAALLPAYSADIFLGRNFGAIFTLIAIGGGLGGASGTYLCGLLFDIFHAYTIPFTICCVLLVVSNILIWLAAPRKIRKMVRVETG